jgi:hypothetical protein
MQDRVTLSVTKAELMAVVSCMQYVIYAKDVVILMGLRIQLSVDIQIKNKGSKDLFNKLSVGGRTRYIEVNLNYMRELKEKGKSKISWISSKENLSDTLTKNLPSVDYIRRCSIAWLFFHVNFMLRIRRIDAMQ